MLFAAYTPQPSYTPQRTGASPWVIVAGVCGGCLLVVVIAAFVIGYLTFKQPFTQRTITMAQFTQAIKKHDYAKAEQQLTPDAQARYNAAWLGAREEAAEKSLGPLQTMMANYQNGQVKGIGDLNKMADVPYTLVYARGDRRIVLHFDQNSGDNKIADIKWPDGSDGGAKDSSSGSQDPGTQQ